MKSNIPTKSKDVEQKLVFKDFKSVSIPRKSIEIIRIGNSRSPLFENIEGILLKDVLHKAGVKPDLNTVFLVSAPDGYRALFTYWEVFFNPTGENTLIADTIGGHAIEKMEVRGVPNRRSYAGAACRLG